MNADAARAFFAAHKAELLADPTFAAPLARISLGPRSDGLPVADIYDILAGEGVTALRLIADQLRPGQRILEVGAGSGFAHLWLLEAGHDALALEPSAAGHDGAYQAGRALLGHFGRSDATWSPLGAEDVPGLGLTFDLIFSNNVLEHVAELERALAALASVLAPGGVMRHNCPNYAVPYEPHYGLPLVPLYPQATVKVRPELAGEGLWQGLNFVTAARLERVADELGLELAFDRDHFYNTVARLESDATFAAKHPGLARVFKLVAPTGLPRLLKLLPPRWLTPMQTSWRRASDRDRRAV